MTDCTYRSWPSVTEPYVGRTYADVLQESSTKFSHTLHNDFAFYTGLAQTPSPFSSGQYKFSRSVHQVPSDPAPRELLTQWIERKHAVRPDEAVIAIIGNSVTPEGWFSDDPVSQAISTVPYINYAGDGLLTRGFDIFAPFTTHISLFQTYQARLANTYGMKGYDGIDTLRVVEVFKHVSALGYSKIHLVGTSGGGLQSVLASRRLGGHPQLGMALAIEGWFAQRQYTEIDMADGFYTLPWGATFSWGGTLANFLTPPVNAYFARSTCGQHVFERDYVLLPKSRVMIYDGSHEFRLDVFDWALAQYRRDFEDAEPPPPPGNHPPVVTVTGSITNTAGNMSNWRRGDQLPITISDADGDAITKYRFTDVDTASTSAKMWFGGANLAQGSAIELTPAQLSGLYIGPGTIAGTDVLRVQVFDGTDWSAPADITINSV